MLLKLQQQTFDKLKKVESRVELLASSMAELKKIIEDKEQKSFSFKESKYEV